MLMYSGMRSPVLKGLLYRTVLPYLITREGITMGYFITVFPYYLFTGSFSLFEVTAVSTYYPHISVYDYNGITDTSKDGREERL
ncbi:hypothetical protein BMS3Abin08_01691 [bacterium BMS3Abin08]|nr:hypothetical protein BMS3Abin08_01691 [bacterium BMS3Abin08]